MGTPPAAGRRGGDEATAPGLPTTGPTWAPAGPGPPGARTAAPRAGLGTALSLEKEARQLGEIVLGTTATSAALVLGIVSSALFTAVTLYQWFLLATRGQTLGKRLCGIRIVDLKGNPAGLAQALLLRCFLFGAALSVVGSALTPVLPFAAFGLGLLDCVTTFGTERRCLHDYFSGTQVRWVTGSRLRIERVVGVLVALAAAGTVLAIALGGGPAESPAVVAALTLEAPAAVPGGAGEGPALPALEPEVRATRSEPAAAPEAPAPPSRYFQYEDEDGAVHVVDDRTQIPARLRGRAIELH